MGGLGGRGCGGERVPGDAAVVSGPQSCGSSLTGGEMEKKEVLIELLQTKSRHLLCGVSLCVLTILSLGVVQNIFL